jgi:hypothetical protein
MPDKVTYDSEMNQSVHRPGMEKVVNRADDARDSSGNREGGRRSVAPPTRSAFGADSTSDPAPKEEAPSASPAATTPLSIVGTTRTAQNLQTADDQSK